MLVLWLGLLLLRGVILEFSKDIIEAVQRVSARLRDKGLMLACAESCTGGLIASALTDISGSSDIFDRGFVTYSNQAKQEMLAVPLTTLNTFGAVSEETALAMAHGAINNSQAGIAVSVTGIAGPSGGTAEKPVGLVYFGLADNRENSVAYRHVFKGSRSKIREQTVLKALQYIKGFLG